MSFEDCEKLVLKEEEVMISTNPIGVTCPGDRSLFPTDSCFGWCFTPQSGTWWLIDLEILYYITQAALNFTSEEKDIKIDIMMARDYIFEEVVKNVCEVMK